MAPLQFFISSSDEVHTPAPDFFELKPVLRPGQVTDDESRSAAERSPALPSTLWRKDVTGAGGDGAYYKNKQFHQGNHIPLQGDHSVWQQHSVDLDLECSAIMPGQ